MEKTHYLPDGTEVTIRDTYLWVDDDDDGSASYEEEGGEDPARG